MSDDKQNKERSVSEKWSPKIAGPGFAPVPTAFLDNYTNLIPPISPGEAMLLIHIMRYKWGNDAPYPGIKTLAKQMGRSDQMIRTSIRSLEQKKYLRREARIAAPNRYHFQGLFEALEKLMDSQKPKAPKHEFKSPEITGFGVEQVTKLPTPPSKKPPLPKAKTLSQSPQKKPPLSLATKLPLPPSKKPPYERAPKRGGKPVSRLSSRVRK